MNGCLRCGHDSNIGLRLDEETPARCLPARAPDEVGSAGRVETETSARFSARKEAPGFGRESMEAWQDSETVPLGGARGVTGRWLQDGKPRRAAGSTALATAS
jgi:hypothetical protein